MPPIGGTTLGKPLNLPCWAGISHGLTTDVHEAPAACLACSRCSMGDHSFPFLPSPHSSSQKALGSRSDRKLMWQGTGCESRPGRPRSKSPGWPRGDAQSLGLPGPGQEQSRAPSLGRAPESPGLVSTCMLLWRQGGRHCLPHSVPMTLMPRAREDPRHQAEGALGTSCPLLSGPGGFC